jgi:hypothetical protein
MVKYCVANQCPIDTSACAYAAGKGNLEMLKYLHEEVKAPWEPSNAAWAIANGHLHILEYLVERKYDKYHGKYTQEDVCMFAAIKGQLDCLKYLHETVKAPLSPGAVHYAYNYKYPECLQYLLDNNCPLPTGWRYEHGELHVP